jgi:hypothetical protein
LASEANNTVSVLSARIDALPFEATASNAMALVMRWSGVRLTPVQVALS